ncbi:MAG TPA: hypothetical protein VFT64_04435 [Rickettsiales bacterium]|nr:hypothetical protein [Rickettsiales bacterium]
MDNPYGNSSVNHFATKNVAFQTTKSVALAGTISTALLYALTRVAGIRGALPGSMAAGTLIGGYYGYNKYQKTRIDNYKAETLNRYESSPLIQYDILAQTGAPDFHYTPTKLEHNLSNINLASFTGSWVSDINDSIRNRPLSRLTQALYATTFLSFFGGAAVHIKGLNQAVKQEAQNISFAERIALQRAASAMNGPPAAFR